MKTMLVVCGLVLRFCWCLITCIFLLSCLSSFVFESLSFLFLFFSICYLKLSLFSIPLLLFPYFLLHSFQAFLVPTYFKFLFTRDQRTRGPEHYTTTGPKPQDQSTTAPEDQRTTGPEDHRTTRSEDHSSRGPQDQTSLNFFSRGCKYFFQGT